MLIMWNHLISRRLTINAAVTRSRTDTHTHTHSHTFPNAIIMILSYSFLKYHWWNALLFVFVSLCACFFCDSHVNLVLREIRGRRFDHLLAFQCVKVVENLISLPFLLFLLCFWGLQILLILISEQLYCIRKVNEVFGKSVVWTRINLQLVE